MSIIFIVDEIDIARYSLYIQKCDPCKILKGDIVCAVVYDISRSA